MNRPGKPGAGGPPGASLWSSGGHRRRFPAAGPGNMPRVAKALTPAARRKMLEEIAADEEVKATQRLRALEELGRMDSREAGGAAADADAPEDLAPDPMADLDELEQRRRKRAS